MSEPQPIPVRETPEYGEGWRKAVEECARVVDNFGPAQMPYRTELATAIRALKEVL